MLNAQQKLAVNHIEGPLLVLAGAGSGKTRIVTQRVSHLISIGVPASEILAVTFTNKAANEMKKRIQTLCNQYVLTCTFHSLGARILRESIHLLGFSNGFTIYDEEDSNKLIKNCIKSLGFKEDRSLVKAMKTGISESKNNLKSPGDLKDPSFHSHEFALLKEVYTLYQQKLKEYNALDFDDLLFQTVNLLRTSDEARKLYQSRWNFLLIDEYQDTNMAQYVLTRILVEKHQNLFVVGDPDQSIYSWRGANINNILNFEEDFDDAKVIKLEQNYRSTNHILSAANSLIENNSSRYEKNLWSTRGDGNKVNVHVLENEREEAQFVVSRVLKAEREGSELGEIVIFYRTNAQSRVFEDELLKYQVPYKIIGGMSFYQRKEVKDILAYLKCSISESDFLSFSRVINVPKRGLGPSAIQKIKDLSEKLNLPILEACKTVISNSNLKDVKFSAKQVAGIKEFIFILDQIKESLALKKTLKEIVTVVIQESEYLEFLQEDKETFDDRKDNIDELVNKANEWELERSTGSLEMFLEELSLQSSSDDSHGYQETLKLMSLHNGKGLEFNICFIVGLEEDLLPHINSKESSESLEEERRLCYVGMTRAKSDLFLTASKYRMFWGSPKNMVQSRFLSEIDEKHINWPEKEEIESQVVMFSPGSYVVHKDFGKGIVKKSYVTSLGTTYDVFFEESHSTKSLVAKFAKLKNF